MAQNRKLGRPRGSKTFREPHGVKYARRYLDLWAGSGVTPTAAAKQVALEWGVSESDVFHAYKRHMERLQPEMEQALRVNYVWFGRWLIRCHPAVADAFARRYLAEFQHALDETARRLDSLGNSAGTQAIRAFNPARTNECDAWLALLGQFYLDFLKPRLNNSIR